MVEGGSPRSDKRLLVLGAGPAQLGLLEAAHDRGLYVIAVDRDPLAPGFRFADRRAIVSGEDEPAIDRLAGAERVDGVVAPGIDFPVAIAATRAARASASARPADGAGGDVEAAPARALRRGRRPARAAPRLLEPDGRRGGGGGARLPVCRQST